MALVPVLVMTKVLGPTCPLVSDTSHEVSEALTAMPVLASPDGSGIGTTVVVAQAATAMLVRTHDIAATRALARAPFFTQRAFQSSTPP